MNQYIWIGSDMQFIHIPSVVRATLKLLCCAAGVSLLFPSVGARAQAPKDGVHDRQLNAGWQFRAIEGSREAAKELPAVLEWHSASVPGVVQTDLLTNKLIGDPFYRDNEASLQWIGRTDWEYRTTFEVSAADLRHRHMELVFDGLDTLAEVYVNKTQVLKANNMFRNWRVPVKKSLHPGTNEIRIIFHSPITALEPVVKALPYHLPTVGQVQAISEDGIAVDPYIRKAPYQFGWDWGPRFVTLGIWQPIHLQTWDVLRVENFHIQQLKINKDVAELSANIQIDADHAGAAEISVSYKALDSDAAPSAAVRMTVPLDAGSNSVSLPFRIPHPQLWYPAHYGAQARYEFNVQVMSGGRMVAVSDLKTGLRSVELRRENDQWGKSFEFVINGIPVFAKGADVIPFDSFPDRVTRARHRQILESARDANMNMVRAWGGGYYESNDFYEIADELGIMVWQEFMFGGAMVPGGTEFRDNVRAEALDQVRRLRDYPSVVLWCGNNEVETGWRYWGDRQEFKKSITPDQREEVWQNYLLLFNDTLKSVVAMEDPSVPYWPSSPSADYEDIPGGERNGDMHYWQVWHALAPIDDYNKQNPRFMSEYGFQSFPEMRTLRTFALPGDMALNSAVMQEHQKNTGGNDRIHTYLLREYPEPKDFPSFVYLSQVQQAEAIKVGAEHLRRNRPRTMGSLYWQLNDCWPVASWASIDYYGRWKALQYYARRFYADQLISPYAHDGVIDTYVVSDILHPTAAQVRVRLMRYDGTVLQTQVNDVKVAAQSSTIVWSGKQEQLLQGADTRQVFAVYELLEAGKPVSRNLLFFAPEKELALPMANVGAELKSEGDGYSLILHSENLARHVFVDFGDTEATVSDNYLDLLPGESVKVSIKTTASENELRQRLHITTVTDAYGPTVRAN